MMYTILKNDFKPELTGMTLKGVATGEYIAIEYKGSTIYFLAEYVREYKEQIKTNKFKTNKTAVINSIEVIWNDDRQKEDVKQVLRIKKGLKQRSVKDDIQDIEYYYNRLIELFIGSCRQYIDYSVSKILKNTVQFILTSDINIDKYNKKECESILRWM